MPRSASVPMNLLLVDDKRENLVSLKGILERPEYHLFTASSGEEALKIALREPLAVILLDVVMPTMDGYEVARYLKTVERTRHVPIIFLTALATDVQEIYRAYDVGAVDYLVKPLDAEVVRKKVAVFVDLVRQREQIREQAESLREKERREYELQIAELRVASDRRYRKLVEGIDHAIGWTTNDRFALTFVSRQAPRILGYSLEEFVEPDFWREHLHPDDRDEVLATFEKALTEGTDQVCNHRLRASDGHFVWLHTGVSGEPDVRGPAKELHGISVDVTDLKHAQEEALRATHVREELLAIVAHDLRNPLASIQTSAGLLERVAETSREPSVQKSAATIMRSAKRMDRLIGDLLDFALIRAERLTLQRGEIDSTVVVQESLEMFRPVASEKSLRLDEQVDGDLRIIGDHDRVLQILSNLVGNAIKFTGEGGSIVVRAEASEHEAVFTVADTGEGMAPEVVSSIWERYWQAKRRVDGGGVGLGLSIAKGLVEAHGGRIWAESTLGVGTTVYFTIPLATVTLAHRDGKSAPKSIDPAHLGGS